MFSVKVPATPLNFQAATFHKGLEPCNIPRSNVRYLHGSCFNHDEVVNLERYIVTICTLSLLTKIPSRSNGQHLQNDNPQGRQLGFTSARGSADDHLLCKSHQFMMQYVFFEGMVLLTSSTSCTVMT